MAVYWREVVQRERIASISGLKGLSCLIIMIYHYRFILLDKGLEFVNYGYYCVNVFVSVSGFLMAYNYRHRIADMNFKDFFGKRYMSVMPLYWITEAAMYIAVFMASLFAGEKFRWNLLQLVLEFSGFYTGWFGRKTPPLNNPLWTVCCLLFCYIVFFMFGKIRKQSVYILIIIGCMICGTCMLQQGDLIQCVLSFVVGMILYEGYRWLTEKSGKIVCFFLMMVLTGIFVMERLFFTDKTITMMLGDEIVIFLVCPLVIYAVIYIRQVRLLCTGWVLQFVGEISLDIYMWHWIVRVYLGSRPFYVDQNTWTGWAILIIVTLVVSIFSHYIFMPWMYGNWRIRKNKNG